MRAVITVFEDALDQGRGMARDMPVRWAFEETGQAYDTRPLTLAAMKEVGHRTLQPFGQIPSYQEGALALFESGAIVLHLAQRHAGLLPADPAARARAVTWMFAALSTIEPPIVEGEMALLLERGQPWFAQRQPMLEERIRKRLGELAGALGGRDWLEGAFSAGDLLMVSVLRRLRTSRLLDEQPVLRAYVDRGEARPAFERAFAAQLAWYAARQAQRQK